VKYTFTLFAALALAGCGEMVDKSRAVEAMEAAGYKNVIVTDQHGLAPGWYGCGKDDAVAFDVTATNPVGARTKAVACCGLIMKGCTIRH
jgi:hypothetical protein